MYLWICLGGVVLLLIVFVITSVFQTPWQEWRHKQDTTRRDTQKWTSGNDPFKKYRN